MKNSLKHMFEISGGVSLCFLAASIVSNVMLFNYKVGYGYVFLQGFLGLSTIVFVASFLGVFLLNVNFGKTGLAKRLANDDD